MNIPNCDSEPLDCKVINSGDLFVISREPYSDYGITGLYVALKDMDYRKEREFFQMLETDNYMFDEFVAKLVRDGKIKAVTCKEWWLGEYGKMEDMRITNLGDR